MPSRLVVASVVIVIVLLLATIATWINSGEESEVSMEPGDVRAREEPGSNSRPTQPVQLAQGQSPTRGPNEPSLIVQIPPPSPDSMLTEPASPESEGAEAADAVRSDPVRTLSDFEIRQILVLEAVGEYAGSCPCPYSFDSFGRRCGGRSEYSRPGGDSPMCYETHVPQSMVDAYRQSHFGLSN